MKKFAISALAAAITLGISACSSDNPDSGTTNQFGTVSGTVVDAYVAGATVYLDINNNGRKDAGEPYAITDKDGSFTTSKDDVNYCAATATALQQRHCLRSANTGSEVPLRAYGGFDVLSGEPFVGTLSTTVTTVAGGAVADQMLSPLTSVLMELSIEDRAAFLSSLGLTEEHLNNDFLDQSSFDANTLARALEFHKVVTIFAKVLEDTYDGQFGTNSDFPTNSSGLIYQALATHANLDNAANLDAAFNAAEAAIRALYAAADPVVAAPSAISLSDKQAARNNALKIRTMINNINLPSSDFEDVEDLMLTVELAVQKLNELPNNVDATIALATDPESGLRTLLSAEGDVDFKELVDAALSDGTDFDDYAIPAHPGFNGIVGKQLSVSYDDEDRNGDAYFFFNAADEEATAGTLNTCIRYNEPNTVSDEETTGSYLDATWFAIDDKRMVVTLGDGAYNITIISKGPTEGGDLFSLSYGGETRTWLSEDGLLDSDDVDAVTEPTDDASCAALFSPVE